MLSPVELGTVAAASLGGLTMAWGNIKGVFARFESLFIVKAQLQGNMSYDFMNYCWAKLEITLFAQKIGLGGLQRRDMENLLLFGMVIDPFFFLNQTQKMVTIIVLPI